jgi:hypothetical protein
MWKTPQLYDDLMSLVGNPTEKKFIIKSPAE